MEVGNQLSRVILAKFELNDKRWRAKPSRDLHGMVLRKQF